eukprot:1730647-Pyramimonas_sp.AAC.1
MSATAVRRGLRRSGGEKRGAAIGEELFATTVGGDIPQWASDEPRHEDDEEKEEEKDVDEEKENEEDPV